MGIYTDLGIFGIKIYLISEDNISNILFESKYDTLMSDEQIREAYLFYKELHNNPDIHFQLYTECSSTYGEGVYMDWHPISRKVFLEKFAI